MAFDPKTAVPASTEFDPTTAAPTKTGFGARLGDIGLSLVKGAVAVPEAAVGVADLVTGGKAGKVAESLGFRPKEAKAFLESQKSAAAQDAGRRFQDAEGFTGKLGAAIENPSLIVNAVAESAPLMGAGGVVGRGIAATLPRAAGAAGAIGEGAVGAGSAAEQIRQQTADGELTGTQTALAAGTGVATGLLGMGGKYVAGKLGVGDIDQAIATGSTKVAGPAGKEAPGMLKRVGGGALAEGVFEELPQSVAEQGLQNLALDQPFTQDLDAAAAMGLVTGGAMGAGMGIISSPEAKTPDPGPVAPPAAAPGAPAPVVDGAAPAATPIAASTLPLRDSYVEASKDLVAGGKAGDVIRVGDKFLYAPTGSPELAQWQSDIAQKSGIQSPAAPIAAAPLELAPMEELGAPQRQLTDADLIAQEQVGGVRRTYDPRAGVAPESPLGLVPNVDGVPFDEPAKPFGQNFVMPERPSVAMGLDPAIGGMTTAAALAVDSGASPAVTQGFGVRRMGEPMDVQPITGAAGQIGTPRRLGETPIIDMEAREVKDQQAIAGQAPRVGMTPRIGFDSPTPGATDGPQANQTFQTAAQRTEAQPAAVTPIAKRAALDVGDAGPLIRQGLNQLADRTPQVTPPQRADQGTVVESLRKAQSSPSPKAVMVFADSVDSSVNGSTGNADPQSSSDVRARNLATLKAKMMAGRKPNAKAAPVPAGQPQADAGAAQAPVKKEAQPQAMRVVVRRDITGDEFEVQGSGVNGDWEKQTTFRTADAANDFLKSWGHDVGTIETLVSEWSPKLKRFSQPKRQESTTPAQAEPVAAAVAGQPEQKDALIDVKNRAYKVASGIFGKDIYSPGVQNDWQKLLDAVDAKDAEKLKAIYKRYENDVRKEGYGAGTSGAGPGRVGQARRGAGQLGRFAAEAVTALGAQQPEQAQPLSDAKPVATNPTPASGIGQQWTRSTTVDREGMAVRAGLTPKAAKNLAKRGWGMIDPVARDNIERGLKKADTKPAATNATPENAKGQKSTKTQSANLDPQGLLSDDERQMLGEFTRLYQTDLKADIRQRLGLTPKEQATAPTEKKKPSALLSLIVQMGGIKSGLSADLTSANAMEGNRRHPGLFRNNGKQLDVLVQSLKEHGYLTQADEDSILDNGGTNKLADMIQAELSGARAKLADSTDGFEAMRDADMRHSMEDKATALGLSQDMVTSMSDARLNGAIKRIEARLGHPIKTDFATRKMSRAEARAEREAILMADRYERARAKYDAELQAFAEADDMVQDAVLDVVADEDGNVEIVYARAVEVAAASDALNGTWSDQDAEVDTRRVGAGQENSGQAGPPVASTAEAGAGNPEANRSEAGAGSQKAGVVRTYKTRSGEIGAAVKRNISQSGVATYGYIGKWGAGSGHSAEYMAEIEADWKSSKKGFTVESGPADAAPETEALTTYTPAEVTARRDAATEAEATAKRAEDAAARAEAAAKQASEIAQRSVAAADTFELGGNAEDNLSGQGDIFSAAPATQPAQAESPKLTQAEAAELMEWQNMGQTDNVQKHTLFFYESKADKDAKRGRMAVATITKGDRSPDRWMVDGDDQRFGPLALAKKRGMEIGMAKAVADGFVVAGEVAAKPEPKKSEAKPASKTPTADAHAALMDAVRTGKATPEQFKAGFEAVVAGAEVIKAELGTHTKPELLKMGGPYMRMRYASENKPEIIDALYREMLGEFLLGESLTYGMGKNSYRDAIAKRVETVDADKLAKYVEDRKAAIEEAALRRVAAAKAVADPQTLDDFKAAIRAAMMDGKTRKEAYLTLTPEQRIRYDELDAESTREARETRKRAQKTQVQAAGQTTGGQIIAAKHTRDGYDLFVVQLSDRLSKEDYSTVLSSAKRLGGWYSAFRGNGATPGFQFKEKASAEAFLKLAGGDTTAAKDQAAQRRDAFEDDRSQTAAERLTEMADRLEAQADAELGRDRKANTARRARFSASAEKAASNVKALAKTMRNIATAIGDGKAKFLDAVRQKTQVEMLAGVVATAKYNELGARFPEYADREKRNGEPPTIATADFAEFPTFTAFRSDLASLARQMLEVDGTKKLGQQLMGVADDVTDAYLDFAKKNLHLVSTFKLKDGSGATFSSKETGTNAIRRSGLTGKAILLPVKRGENVVVMSPSEAMNRGVWKGDGDKRITLTKDAGMELVEAIGRKGNQSNGLKVPWQFETAADRLKALSRMGIETPSEFRSAVREFISLRVQAQEADRVKAMERAMVGRKADGLDFFPTPAEVADQMVEAAEVQAGMRVLEPSAGMGHLADRIRAAGAEPDVVELSGDRRELLEEKGYNVVANDFTAFTAPTERGFTFGDLMRATDGTQGILRGQGGMGSDRVRLVSDDAEQRELGKFNLSELEGIERRGVDSGYDRIIMNPPFGDRRDAEHVRHAYSLLKPGGRLVAIMGEGVFFGKDKKAEDFREWLDALGGTSEKLPDGSFMDPSLPVTTGVNARMVVVDREEDAPAFSRSRPAFSRAAKGQASTVVQGIVDSITARWANAPKVVVAFDMDDPVIPEAVRKEDQRQRSGGATGTPEGFYYKGTVYLMSSNLTNPRDVVRVLFHEALGHFGLRGVFGKELKPILQQIATMRKAQIEAKMKEYGLRGVSNVDRLVAAEEVLAEMAQDSPQIGFVRRAIATIKAWLRNHIPGFGKMVMTDDEIISNFIIPARNFVVNGGPNGGPGGGVRFSRDSDGTQDNAVKRESTETPQFKQWFGDSKVVDADGEPLVVYHGTDADFTEFKTRKQGSNTGAKDARMGFWFSSDAEHAGNFNASNVANRILPVYLGLKNPLVVDHSTLDASVAHPRGEKYESSLRTDAISKAKKAGHDGVIFKNTFDSYAARSDMSGAYRVDLYVAFRPEQIKSAIGNNGDFDGDNPDIRFSRSMGEALTAGVNNVRDLKLPAGYKVNDLMKTSGKLGWWSKTVGTQYHLAQRSPVYKRVFDAAQGFLNDVSYYASEAANQAPTLLPKLETFKDLGKQAISAADNKAIAAPIFEGTLVWGWSKDGRAVRLADENDDTLEAGVVFTPDELRLHFGLNDKQIALYQEFRAATDKSLTNMGLADLVRFGGKDLEGVAQEMLDAENFGQALAIAGTQLRAVAKGEPKRAAVLLDTIAKMAEKVNKYQGLMDKGYAPLSRFGRHTLDVVDEGGARVYFGLFESEAEANKMARQMQANYPGAQVSQGTVSEEEHKLFAGVSPETVELFGEMLGLEGTGDEAADMAFQQYLKMAKANRSAMKRLIHRKGIAGFSEDPGRVLAGFVYSNARQTSSAVNMGELTQAVAAIPKGEGELKDHAVRLHNYVKNPIEEAQAFRGLLFAQYIGGSVASAIINTTQPFAVTMPWLSQFGGISKAAKQMGAAAKDALKGATGDAALDRALLKAAEDGIVSPQEVFQLQAQAAGRATLKAGDGTKAGDAMATASNVLSKLGIAWGQLFGLAEQFNRRTTFIAAYRTAVEQGMADPAAFAERAINETQFIYSKANKPRWARGAVGATLFTFKQYSISYVELMSRLASSGTEGKKAALLGLAILFLLSGAGGLPFAEDVDDVIDGIMQRLGYNFSTKQAKQEFFAELLGEDGAKFMMRGISGVAGVPVDVSGRFGMGNLIPSTGLLTKKADYTSDFMELAGPAGDLVKRAAQTVEKLARGEVLGAQGALATAAPLAGQNVVKAMEMANTGMYLDKKGRKVLDVDGYDATMKAIGFQPNQIAEVQDATYDQQRMVGVNRMRESEIADRWARGLFLKDAELVAQARESLAEWNANNPDTPIQIKMPQILRRLREMNLSKTERVAKAAPQEVRARVREELGMP